MLETGSFACLKCANVWGISDQISIIKFVLSVLHPSTRNFDFSRHSKSSIEQFRPDWLTWRSISLYHQPVLLTPLVVPNPRFACSMISAITVSEVDGGYIGNQNVVECGRSSIVSLQCWYQYQRTTYQILSLVLIRLMILSKGYSALSVLSLWYSLVEENHAF